MAGERQAGGQAANVDNAENPRVQGVDHEAVVAELKKFLDAHPLPGTSERYSLSDPTRLSHWLQEIFSHGLTRRDDRIRELERQAEEMRGRLASAGEGGRR